MNDILEFLGEGNQEEKIFPEDLLKLIIEVLKDFSIYEYKIISGKIKFHFCDCDYIISISENRENAYEIIFGPREDKPSGRTWWLTSDKLIKRLVDELVDELDYRRCYINNGGISGINYGVVGGSGYKGITGCPGVEIYGQKPIKSITLPIIYCPYIPLTLFSDD